MKSIFIVNTVIHSIFVVLITKIDNCDKNYLTFLL